MAIISPLGIPNSIAIHGLQHSAADGIPPNGLAALPCTLGNAFGRIHWGGEKRKKPHEDPRLNPNEISQFVTAHQNIQISSSFLVGGLNPSEKY